MNHVSVNLTMPFAIRHFASASGIKAQSGFQQGVT
jgi:hypothetical protein